MPHSDLEIRAQIEAALYAAGRPLDVEDLMRATDTTSKHKILKIMKEIMKSLNENMIAIEIVDLPGQKFAMQLKTQYTTTARKFSLRPLLSQPVLKTLSHIIYFQPVSSSELAARRGSQVYTHLKKLRELGFVDAKRLGRNNIYRTSHTFSEYFGVSSEPDKIKKELFPSRSEIVKQISKKV